MGWYKTGTVALQHGSVAVIGTGTDFIANVTPGGIFIGPDGRIYEVDGIVSATQLNLVGAYGGVNAAGAGYAIAPTQSYIVELAQLAATMLNTFSGFRDDYLAGNLVGAGLELKGVLSDASQLPATGSDGDTYLINGSLYVWAKVAWRSSSIQGPKGDVGDVNPANLEAAASALDSKTNAAASAAAALASQQSADQSATTATTQAAAAVVSATAAAGARDIATAARDTSVASATSATGSATTASAAAAALTAMLANFKEIYLGEFAADPQVDGNGAPLKEGAEYFNTTSNKLRVYGAAGWKDYDDTAQTATSNAILSAANAAASASAASASVTAAATSAGAAHASEINAAGSATAASTSATTAAAQAGIAVDKATAAAASAAEAANYAEAATTGQVNADWNAVDGKGEILNKPFIPKTAADVGLDKVSNTADVDKPVSAAQQNALDQKVDTQVFTAATATFLHVDTPAQGLSAQQQQNAQANLGITDLIAGALAAQLAPLQALIYAGL